MARIPIAVQLYSVRDDCAKDLPGVLEAIADMGYDGVEFAGYYGRSGRGAEAHAATTTACVLRHAHRHAHAVGNELAATIEFNRTLGNRSSSCPAWPRSARNSRDGVAADRRSSSTVSPRRSSRTACTSATTTTTSSSRAMDGELPWDTFFGNADPRVVMQLDTGNALHGGGDPVPYVERYPGRALTVHLKEYSATKKGALDRRGRHRLAAPLRPVRERRRHRVVHRRAGELRLSRRWSASTSA